MFPHLQAELVSTFGTHEALLLFVQHQMRLEARQSGELLPTLWTHRVLWVVDGDVQVEIVFYVECLAAFRTAPRFVFFFVRSLVTQVLVPLGKFLVTYFASMWSLNA